MASRKPDLNKIRAAYTDGMADLGTWIGRIPADQWDRPSVLDGWAVRDLAAHIALVGDSVTALRPAPGQAPLGVGAYLSSYAAGAETIAERTRETARQAGGPDDVRAMIAERSVAADAVLDELGAATPVVQARRGPIRLTDFLATRCIEVAVHADDLARSVPGVAPPEPPRDCVRIAVRTLLDALAEQAPGRSVEVRVPPVGAVQCVEGPRHTRGTPSNVVEMDVTTWLRVAAGREPLDEAVRAGRVTASGGRADLTPLVPLL